WVKKAAPVSVRDLEPAIRTAICCATWRQVRPRSTSKRQLGRTSSRNGRRAASGSGRTKRRTIRREIIGERVDGEPNNEAYHFITCPTCGRLVDMRELGQVLLGEIKSKNSVSCLW